MKRSLIFSLGISMLTYATIIAATTIKILTLGASQFDDSLYIFGIPVTHIINGPAGFSMEFLPGSMAVAGAIGAVTFATLVLRQRSLQNL